MTSTFDLFDIFNDAGHRFAGEASLRRTKAENARQQQDQRTAEHESQIAESLETEARTLFEMARRFRADQTEPAWVPPTPLPDFLSAAA